MSGNQWSPNNDLNPAKTWDYVTGLVGFVYETPFRYDPLKDKFIPWLATSGKWTSQTTYAMTVRRGVKWSDGKPMTAADVKYSFDLLEDRDAPQHALWADTGPEERQGRGQQRRVHVRREARLPAVRLLPLQRRDRAAAHLLKTTATPTSRPATCPTRADRRHRPVRLPVRRRRAVAEMVVEERTTTGGRRRRSASRSAPTYVVDIKNGTNAAALAEPARRQHRPVQQLRAEDAIKGNVQDVLQQRPVPPRRQHGWLFPNTTKKPLERPAVPACARRLDQPAADRRQGLPGPRHEGEPDGPAADLEQVDQQEAS